MPASTWILGGLVALGLGDVAAIDLVIGPRALAPAETPARTAPPTVAAIETTVPSRVEVTSTEPAPPPPPAPEPAPSPAVDEDLAPVTIYFETDHATLDRAATDALDALATSLARHPAFTVGVVGHADARGSEHHNLQLSQRRMERVRAYLGAHGVDLVRVRGRAAGAREPARSGTTAAALAANRRAEIRRTR